MSKKTLEELLRENNKKINIEELTKKGYNTINDFLKLNKDGNLLGFLKEALNDENDAHFLSRIIEKQISKGFMGSFVIIMAVLIVPLIIMLIWVLFR